ncbi:LamG domain-containing protein [Candidatus Woesearchaeota archaeon]|nr:LamG domain-containing protein [Candidatus Woesearchaeota archaeon]
MEHKEKNTMVYMSIVAIVAIVAIFGLVVIVSNNTIVSSGGDTAGAAFEISKASTEGEIDREPPCPLLPCHVGAGCISYRPTGEKCSVCVCPKMFYELNEGSGIDIFDSSEYNNPGIKSGTANWLDNCSTGGNCLNFNGGNISTQLKIDQSSQTSTGATFFVSVQPKPYHGTPNYDWCHSHGGANYCQIISTDDNGHDWSLILNDLGVNGARFAFFNGNGWIDTDLYADEWHWQHLAIVFDKPNNQVVIFKDGTRRNYTGLGYDSSTDFLAIGENPGNYDEEYKGWLDNVKIFNEPLPPEAVCAELSVRKNMAYCWNGANCVLCTNLA